MLFPQQPFISDPHLKPPVHRPHPRNTRTVAILKRYCDKRREGKALNG